MSGTAGPSGRGGYLLPAGYVSTSGNQTVDANGNPVRIDSVGWFGGDEAGGAPVGLYATSYQNIMDSIKADGFNTIRLPWSDANLNQVPQARQIDFSQNPSLQGLTALQIYQTLVAYAGQIGLKVIFDHHSDNGLWGQQPNGLWFDSGPGSDGTDGGGNPGTVTAAQFQADTASLAQTFAGNSTVIGFDLDNQPLVNPQGSGIGATWGGGGPTDIQAMYTNVGNAVEVADPRALIIAEGPQNYSGTFDGPAGSTAPEGDLTAVASDPVLLNMPNKVVYSVHEYPQAISGISPDSGSAAVQRMNLAWGYLETQNIAPVWIGEMGASLDGTDAGESQRAVQAWADTMVGYVNGQDGSQGGPTFSGNQQGIGTDWWTAGALTGEQPDGTQSQWGPPGNYRPGQQAVTDQLLYVPSAGPSPNDTVVMAGSPAAITDANGNVWTITNGAQVDENGAAAGYSASVIELAYVNNVVWQENSSDLWWGWDGSGWNIGNGTTTSPLSSSGGSTGSGGDPPPPVAVLQPLDVTFAGSGANGASMAITDANKNVWAITAGSQVSVNGKVDPTTAGIQELAYVNGQVWQNTKGLWWSKTLPTDGWNPPLGTPTSPFLHSLGAPGEQPIMVQHGANIDGGTAPISYSMIGDNQTMAFMNNSNSTVTTFGKGDKISLLQADGHETIDDAGQGLYIFTRHLNGPVSIEGFGNDPTGLVDLLNAGYQNAAVAEAAERPDGHGGTMLGNIDFVGVSNVAASHFVVANT